MFNSDEYRWKDLTLVLEERPLVELTGLKYKITRVVNAYYASGDDPHGLNKGNKGYEGEIRMLQSGFEALTEEAQSKGLEDVTDLVMQGVAGYARNSQSRQVYDKLLDIHITEVEKGMAQGDTNMEIVLPVKFRKVLHNI